MCRYCFRLFCLLFLLFLPKQFLRAQNAVQSFDLQGLSFQYRSNNTTRNRCLFWFPLAEKEKENSLEYNENGDPYVRLELRARVQGNCKVSFSPSERVSESINESEGEKDRFYTVLVRPPVTVIKVRGSNFTDELLIEAPVERLVDYRFFEFFRKSQVQFESRFSTLTTTNPNAPGVGSRFFPVFGGHFKVPFPWVSNLVAGFQMWQSLANVSSAGASNVQYSEFAFDLRYQWIGREIWGRPKVAGVVDYRGRNIYQIGLSDLESDRPFVLGSTAMVGSGLDLSWYFGATMADWDSWISRIGFDFSTRFYFGGNVGGNAISSQIYDSVLNYRIGKKWALGFGYSTVRQKVGIAGVDVRENFSSYILRFSLVPYLEMDEAE